jgi:hypothetical protein
VDKEDSTLGYISIVGLSVSVGCLVLHLAISAATPRLRNLPAMNLASLCVALLLLYCSFLVRTLLDELPCVELAVVIYYSTLATFCWMLVISFDVWNAIRRSTQKLQLSSGEKKKLMQRMSKFSSKETLSGFLPPHKYSNHPQKAGNSFQRTTLEKQTLSANSRAYGNSGRC